MIALKKEAFDTVKRESIYLALLFLSALIIFKIAFYKEGLLAIFRSVLSIFWMFVLPGYFMMLYWSNRLEFAERLIIGVIAAAGLIGIASYYIGLIGLHIKYHAFLLPPAAMLAGILMAIKKAAD